MKGIPVYTNLSYSITGSKIDSFASYYYVNCFFHVSLKEMFLRSEWSQDWPLLLLL